MSVRFAPKQHNQCREFNELGLLILKLVHAVRHEVPEPEVAPLLAVENRSVEVAGRSERSSRFVAIGTVPDFQIAELR